MTGIPKQKTMVGNFIATRSVGMVMKSNKNPPNPPRIQEFRNYNCNLRCICRIFLFLPDLWPKVPKKFGFQTTSNPYQILRCSKRNLTILPKNQVLRTIRYRIPPKKCVNQTLQQQKLANKLRITAQPDERITSIGSIGSGMFVILASWTEGVTSLLKKRLWGWFSFSSSSHIFGWRKDLLLFFQSSFGAWAPHESDVFDFSWIFSVWSKS